MEYKSNILNEIDTWCHEDIILTLINYGLLYNWWAITDPRNITNSGWHVPTSAEILSLLTTIGVPYDGKLRSIGTDYWLAPNTGALDSFGFHGKGIGLRNGTTGTFTDLKNTYRCHTSDDYVAGFQYHGLYLAYTNLNEGRWGGFNDMTYKKYGYAGLIFNDATTLLPGETGIYIGNDGKYYSTICIGIQECLSLPLAETKYRNGDIIPEVTDNAAWAALITDALCYYNNDPNNL